MNLIESAREVLSEKWGPDQKIAHIAGKYSIPLSTAVDQTRLFVRSLERLELAAEAMRNELQKPPHRRVLKSKAAAFSSAVNATYAPFKEARDALYELASLSGVRTKRYSRKGGKSTPPERMSYEELVSAVEGMIKRLNPAIRDAAEDGSFFLRKAEELLGRMSDRRKVMRLTSDKVDDEVAALVDVFLDFRDKTSSVFWGLAGGIAKRVPIIDEKFRKEYLGESEDDDLEVEALDLEKDPELKGVIEWDEAEEPMLHEGRESIDVADPKRRLNTYAKVAGQISKKIGGRSTRQWWILRKYPGQMIWLKDPIHKLAGVRIGESGGYDADNIEITFHDAAGNPLTTLGVMRIHVGSKRTGAMDDAATILKRMKALEPLAKMFASADSASAAAEGAALPEAKVSTAGGKLVKAHPMIQSYKTLSKGLNKGTIGLYFGKGGKMTQAELDALPTMNGHRVEGVYVKFDAEGKGGDCDCEIELKSGLYRGYGSGTTIESMKVTVPAKDLYSGSGSAKLSQTVGAMLKKAESAGAAADAERSSLSAADVQAKLDEVKEVLRQQIVLNAKIQALNAEISSLRQESQALADKADKGVGAWAKSLKIPTRPKGRLYLVNPMSGRVVSGPAEMGQAIIDWGIEQGMFSEADKKKFTDEFKSLEQSAGVVFHVDLKGR